MTDDVVFLKLNRVDVGFPGRKVHLHVSKTLVCCLIDLLTFCPLNPLGLPLPPPAEIGNYSVFRRWWI